MKRTQKELIEHNRAEAVRLKAKGEEWIQRAAVLAMRADRMERDAIEAALAAKEAAGVTE